MTKDELQTLRGLVDAATPAPWRAISGKGSATVQANECAVYINVSREGVMHPDTIARWQADARFIAAARTALPALIDEAERLTKILDDRMCMKCGGQGEWCVDRCYGNEHYQEMEQCAECNGDGRTEEGAQKKIAALTAERDRLRSALATATTERDALRGEVERLRLAADMLREIPRAALSADKVYREDWEELFTDEDGAALYLDTAVDRVLDRITRKEGK